MLTVVAQFVRAGGDSRIVLAHRARIEAIARNLIALRRAALALPASDPARGMIAAWSEADSALDPEPARYMRPYFGNSAEAARGFADLGRTWQQLALATHDETLAATGRNLIAEGESLARDLHQAMDRSTLRHQDPPCLPAIAGATEPFHIAVPLDSLDPLFRGYRSYMEMGFSGLLTRDEFQTVIRYRAAHRDSILGLPTAYGYNTHELAGFLTYGQAYGLIQHDFIREYLLTLYALMAHQYTRGTWTAPETRNLDESIDAAPYCVPAQLTVPMLTRWMLAFEDPRSETLWLAKATPREWLKDGGRISATDVPTRWGKISFSVSSRLRQNQITAAVEFGADKFPAVAILRLRVPDGRRLESVLLDGKPWADFDPLRETVTLLAGLSGSHTVDASFGGVRPH